MRRGVRLVSPPPFARHARALPTPRGGTPDAAAPTVRPPGAHRGARRQAAGGGAGPGPLVTGRGRVTLAAGVPTEVIEAFLSDQSIVEKALRGFQIMTSVLRNEV